jgi:uncharacterized protein (DUF1499 family)
MSKLTRMAVIPLSIAVLTLAGCAAAAPANVGNPGAAGKLAPCPDSPNCVNTEAPASDTEHAIAPLTYTGSAEDAKARLRSVIGAMPRTRIVADEANYMHAEFTSQIFRFVDDVEFIVDDANKTIHFRSASRVGRGDMGVNRNRMEEIRTRFSAQ